MSKLSKANTSLVEVRPFAGMSQVNLHAAGVDIGAHEIMVCIPGEGNTQLVRAFGNYTVDLQTIAAWLRESGVQTVAMESLVLSLSKQQGCIGFRSSRNWSVRDLKVC